MSEQTWFDPQLCSRQNDLFGGQGEVRVWNLMPRPGEPFTAVLGCELVPQGWVGRHRQEHYPEIVIILEGSGTVEVDGQLRGVGPGSVTHLPLGSILAIRNDSTGATLRYLIIKAST